MRGAAVAQRWRIFVVFLVICAIAVLPFEGAMAGADTGDAPASHCVDVGHHAESTVVPDQGAQDQPDEHDIGDPMNAAQADDCANCCSVCNVSVHALNTGALEIRSATPAALVIIQPGGRTSEPSSEPPRTFS